MTDDNTSFMLVYRGYFPSLSTNCLEKRCWAGAGGERGAMKREKCMYGFQFRIFMRSRHSGWRADGAGGPKRGSQAGYSVMPALKNGQTWREEKEEGAGRSGRAVYMSNLHFQYFLLGRKHQLSSQPATFHARLGMGMVLPGFETAPRGWPDFRGHSLYAEGAAHAPYLRPNSQPARCWLCSLFPPSLPSLLCKRRRSAIYFRKSFLPCELSRPTDDRPIALWKIRNSWKTLQEERASKRGER